VSDLPRLVATDLDGTLVHSDGSITSRTREVLTALENRGVPVVFVTGRPLRWAVDVFEHAGELGLAIVSNGAAVWDITRHRASLLRPFEDSVAREICHRVRQALPGTAYGVETIAGTALEAAYQERYPVPDGSLRAPVNELLAHETIGGSVIKILARHEEIGHQEFWDTATTAAGGLAEVTWSVWDQTFLEISPLGVTKASTLALVCAELGIEAAEVVAFGDMPNDLPMLTWAGTAYAVANAHPSVRAVARPAPGNDEDGVARVLADLYRL
jgi:Cof subfamily protein (haloacid dehalogenase superfamily)